MRHDTTAEPKLADFLNTHAGETAWIFGKGPSIDQFDFAQAGELRCAINDLVGTVPGVVYAFANDNPAAWKDLYRPDHTLFIPWRTVDNEFLRTELPDCRVVVYKDGADDNHNPDPGPDGWLSRSREQMAAERLQVRRGTIGSAVQILHIMGVTRIVAVGIDGGQSHARRSQWRTRLRNEHYIDYNAIRYNFIAACEQLGIELLFFRKADEPLTPGTMRVQVTRPSFVRGMPVFPGIVELNDKDAIDLLQNGKAVPAPVVEIKTTGYPSAEIPEQRAVTKRANRKGKP